MRLIAMSIHSQLGHKIPLIQRYQQELNTLLNIVQALEAPFTSTLINPQPVENQRTLLIIIGSEKGLCGTFNSNILLFFEKQSEQLDLQQTDIVAIGKKLVDTLKHRVQIFKSFEHLSTTTLSSTANLLMGLITRAPVPYMRVLCYSNEPKSFFMQVPRQTQLIPFNISSQKKPLDEQLFEQYIWEQSPTEILDYLAQEYVHLTIKKLLFESLYGEQAARFQSMDNATRNADKTLDVMKLDYNKLRQAKITKELIELVSGYQE